MIDSNNVVCTFYKQLCYFMSRFVVSHDYLQSFRLGNSAGTVVMVFLKEAAESHVFRALSTNDVSTASPVVRG